MVELYTITNFACWINSYELRYSRGATKITFASFAAPLRRTHSSTVSRLSLRNRVSSGCARITNNVSGCSPHLSQDDIQPGEHVRKDSVRMRLAGIKDHIGKDRYDLPKLRRLCQKAFVKPPHVRPEIYASHAELPLEPLLQIGVQAVILLVIQFEVVGDVNRICGGLTVCEESARGLESDFMRNDADSPPLCDESSNSLREELTVEDHHCSRTHGIQKCSELRGNVPGREDVLAQK